LQDEAPPLSGNPTTENPTTGKPLTGNPTQHNIISTVEDINIPPIVPQGTGEQPKKKRRRREHKETSDWKPERFEAFWTFYRENARGEDRQAAIYAWDKLQPSDELITKIGRALMRQVRSEDWMNNIGIPYASTYLNRARWEDAPPKARVAAPERPVMEEQEGVTYF